MYQARTPSEKPGGARHKWELLQPDLGHCISRAHPANGLRRQSASQPSVYLEFELASQQAATNPFQAADERGSTPIARVLFIGVDQR
jgi:hypothetical protein